MSRSVELGRAVLCSPAANLELWLTTLITVSPEQNENNFQQCKPAQLLHFLSSGHVWVGRGHGMHIQLKLTIREEEVALRQIQHLTDAIIRAPIWDQLMLGATVSTDAAVEPGTICLDINHTNNAKTQEEQKRHRLFPDVPAADVRPPNNIQSILLQSVRLSMDILETNPRRKPITKRSSTSPGERQNKSLDAGTSNVLLYDLASVNDTSRSRDSNHTVDRSLILKRKRPATENVVIDEIAYHETSGRSKQPRPRRATDSFIASSTLPDLASPGRLEVENLLDGALRLSICGDLNKTPNKLKVKASTFRFGLSDVAPALWKPGYLSALSQRAHLIPTIAHSLCQVGAVRASSMSLKNKISSLSAAPHEVPRDNEFGSGQGDSTVGSSVTSQLWVHMQKRLPHKSTAPLQAFVVSDAHGAHSDSDDMLAEVDHQTIHQCKLRMSTSSISVDPVEEVGCSDPTRSAFLAILEGDQLRGPASGVPNPRTNTKQLEDDLLLDIDSHDLISTVELPSDENPIVFQARKRSHASTATALRWHETRHVEHSTDHDKNFSSNFRHLPMLSHHELLQEDDLMFGEYGADDGDATDLILPI